MLWNDMSGYIENRSSVGCKTGYEDIEVETSKSLDFYKLLAVKYTSVNISKSDISRAYLEWVRLPKNRVLLGGNIGGVDLLIRHLTTQGLIYKKQDGTTFCFSPPFSGRIERALDFGRELLLKKCYRSPGRQLPRAFILGELCLHKSKPLLPIALLYRECLGRGLIEDVSVSGEAYVRIVGDGLRVAKGKIP